MKCLGDKHHCSNYFVTMIAVAMDEEEGWESWGCDDDDDDANDKKLMMPLVVMMEIMMSIHVGA